MKTMMAIPDMSNPALIPHLNGPNTLDRQQIHRRQPNLIAKMNCVHHQNRCRRNWSGYTKCPGYSDHSRINSNSEKEKTKCSVKTAIIITPIIYLPIHCHCNNLGRHPRLMYAVHPIRIYSQHYLVDCFWSRPIEHSVWHTFPVVLWRWREMWSVRPV